MLSKNTRDIGLQQQDGSGLRRDELMTKIDALEALPGLRARLPDNAVQRELKEAACQQSTVPSHPFDGLLRIKP